MVDKNIIIKTMKLKMNTDKFLRLECQGNSMYPFLRDRDQLKIVHNNEYKNGEIVAYEFNGEIIVHRIVDTINDKYIIIGDNIPLYDDVIEKEKIWGNVVCLKRNNKEINLMGFGYYTIVVMTFSYITLKIRCFWGKKNKFGILMCKVLHSIIHPIVKVIYYVEKIKQ